MSSSVCLRCPLHDRSQIARGIVTCSADPQRRQIHQLVTLGICLHPDGPRFTPTEAVATAAADRPRARGLGDTVARLASAVGIKPCPKCKERQATLNRIVPYRATGAAT